jgi:formylglycine-generating enzyme required for sulfatase activity
LKPKVIRLPVENEWVLAAGGEQNDRFAFGKLKDPQKQIDQYANTSESGVNRASPVWMYPRGKSPKGVMDLSGNVWEWQANLFGKGAFSERTRSLRGGSWVGNIDYARVSFRDGNHPHSRNLNLGFRVVVVSSDNGVVS